jgi:hypothetical protein
MSDAREEPASQPPLPPPPHFAGGTLRTAQFGHRLHLLHEALAQRADFAATAATVAALLLLLLGTSGEALLGLALLRQPATMLVVLALLGGLLLALAALWLVTVLVSIRRVYPARYRRTWQELAADSHSALFADEGLQQRLLEALPSQWWTGSGGRFHPRSLEEQLELCAYHHASFRRLAAGAEPRLATVALEQLAHGTVWLFARPLAFWLIAVAAIVFAPLVVPVLALALYPLLAGRTIAACACLTAYLDSCLGMENPFGASPPPPDAPGWWERRKAQGNRQANPS